MHKLRGLWAGPRLAALAALVLAATSSAQAWARAENGPGLPDAPGVQAAGAGAQGSPGPGQVPPPAHPQETQDYDLKKAEKQRIFGIIPEFQAVNQTGEYAPLTTKQKFNLMWKSSTDPYIFTLDAFVAGIGQAKDSNPDFHQGAEGYFKRYAASYADTFDGNFWGNAVLTSLLHEDPRYFREGESYSPTHRALYSAATALWCRRDRGGWGPNYANVLGNIISGGISNVYYPAADRGVGKTFTGAITVTAEGTIGSELEEFWPDISNHFRKRRLAKEAARNAASNHR